MATIYIIPTNQWQRELISYFYKRNYLSIIPHNAQHKPKDDCYLKNSPAMQEGTCTNTHTAAAQNLLYKDWEGKKLE